MSSPGMPRPAYNLPYGVTQADLDRGDEDEDAPQPDEDTTRHYDPNEPQMTNPDPLP